MGVVEIKLVVLNISRIMVTLYFLVCCPYQQLHNIYINNILYIVSTSTCFDAYTSSGSLKFVFAKGTNLIKLFKLQLNKISISLYDEI